MDITSILLALVLGIWIEGIYRLSRRYRPVPVFDHGTVNLQSCAVALLNIVGLVGVILVAAILGCYLLASFAGLIQSWLPR